MDAIETRKIMIQPKTSDHDKLFIQEVSLLDGEGENIISKASAKAYVAGPSISQRPVIPAQQTYVMELQTPAGPRFTWMGDLWGSASDNIKGHDYQYWSAPLHFDENDHIEPLQWTDSWQLTLKK